MEHKETALQSEMPSVNDAPENIGTSKRITRTRKSARDSSFSASEGLTSQTSERRSTRSARGTLPIDDDGAHYYPCPVPSCDYSSESRSARNYHLRVDHAGYDYQNAAQGSSGPGTSRQVTRKTTREDANRKEAASRKVPTTSTQGVKIESELDDLHPFEAAGVSRIDDYHHVDSSDAYSEIEEFEEGGRYDLSHYSGVDVYAEEKFDSNFVPTPHVNRRRGRPKNPPGTEPAPNSKIRVSDPNGKYKCYMPDCDWRGAYRSLRCDHMKWCHKDWVMPPRYILQRITKDGIYIDPKTFVPPFSCPVEGCTWRGSYRASRSQHVRSVHPDYVPPKKKAPIGGFVADGKYLCHVTGCPWRGISRSTRASHMRKVHGGFTNPTYSARELYSVQFSLEMGIRTAKTYFCQRTSCPGKQYFDFEQNRAVLKVACCDCPLTFVSHKAFVDHVITAHRVGGLVHRDFSDIGEYEEWFNSVQEVFSITYVKRMGIKQGHDYQVLYLYCARSGGQRQKQLTSRDYFPEFTKRRLTRRPTKCGRNCAAFLRIIHWVDGRLTVIGCVEHTGHRMGTALLRLSTNERIVLDEYLYVVDDKAPLDTMLDRIREVEGFTMDGFDVTERNIEDMTRFVMNENEFVSLKVLFETSAFFEPESTFGVKLHENGKPPTQGISFGIMTSQMRELWRTCSARAACIEEVNLLISNFELHLFFVIVFDINDMPRCACVFISQDGDKVALLEKLRSVSTTPVDTIVTDCSPDWPSLLDAYFGNEAYTADFQIAEWHLLSDWAARLDEMVSNRVDRFAIICALRRWTRATDPTLFEGIVIDMFEAFREMDLNPLAQLVDAQLTDPDFAKRWTPLNRNPLTDHSNPVLEISCRMFRDRFLNCELCARLDEYAGLLNERIAEFNSLTFSEVYTTSPMEPPRQVPQMYEDIDPSQLLADGTVMSSPQHAIEVESSSPAPKMGNDGYEHKRMKVEEEIGEYVVVAEEEVLDEVVEGPEAEQLVAEAVLNGALDVDRIDGGLELSQNNSSSDVRSEESPASRKARLKQMMQILREKVDSMADDETMELMESGLTHVVEQLKEPPQNAQNQTPRRSSRIPKPVHQASL